MYNKILIPIDLEDKYSYKLVLKKASKLIENDDNVEVYLMNVVQTYGLGMLEDYFPRNWLQDVEKKTKSLLREIAEKDLPSNTKTHFIIGRGVVYQAILDTASRIEADLIVISAHHPERRDYLLGPNVARVVRHSDISVMVVR